MSTKHATIAQMIDYEIAPSLGAYAADYDIDAIVAALKSAELLQYIEAEGVFELTATEGEFWAIVADHDISEA